MNNKISIDKTVLLILYYRYKEYLLPVILIVVAGFAFTQFILPQFSSWLSLRDQVAVNQQQVSILSENVNTLTRLDDNQLTSLLTIASQALPADKDYAGVLGAISNAASIANVSLGDYSFQIGDIQGNGIQTQGGKLAITIDLTINGGVDDAKHFITALEKQLPLSTVTSLSVQGVSLTTLTVNFYYNPYPPKVFTENVPVQTITASQANFLQVLAANEKLQAPAATSVSSSSAKIK